MAPVYRFLVFIGVCWLPLMLVGADEQQGGGCSRSANRCGNLTISDPFWLAEAGTSCGILDFEVTCYNNNSAFLRSAVPLIPGFAISSISYEERSLLVVDAGKQKLFEASSGCDIQIGNTSAKLVTQFKIDPGNLNLILYNCTEESAVAAAARRDRGLVLTRMRCGNQWEVLARAGVRYDRTGNYASYALEGCDAIVVPVLGSSSGKTNASDYEQLVDDGFLLTWEAPPPPLLGAAHGMHNKKLILIDFGLAKLCHLKGSILSVAETRGTIGFIAPEVFSRAFGVVSTKPDVYSYGMMLLEMVGGRIKKEKGNTESSNDVYFPNWIYNNIAEQIQSCEVICDLEEAMRKMALVGLWCIQTDPENRPLKSKVIIMLEESINELEMPPKPFLSSPSIPSYLSSHTSNDYISSSSSASHALLP